VSNHLCDAHAGTHSETTAPFILRDGAPGLSFDGFLAMAAAAAQAGRNRIVPGRVVVQAP